MVVVHRLPLTSVSRLITPIHVPVHGRAVEPPCKVWRSDRQCISKKALPKSARPGAKKPEMESADRGDLHAQRRENASGVERLVERVARKSHRKRCGECHEACYLCS